MRPDAERPSPEFIYDALRKVAVVRGTSRDGAAWTIEFLERNEDDSMEVVVHEPSGGTRKLTVTESDFVFARDAVTVRCLPAVELCIHPIYMAKLRGFTRGNIPTPDIPGPSLP